MVKTELKERPLVILPCPRCINGQILAINNFECLQCGYADREKGLKEYSGGVKEESQHLRLPRIRPLRKKTERVICPKCGKKVCLNNQAEVMVIRSHKDPVTEGHSERPWCDMSGVVIP